MADLLCPASATSFDAQKTVLIVVDDPIRSEIVNTALEGSELDLCLVTVADRRDAIRALDGGSVDLVVLDGCRPETGHLEVLLHMVNRRIRIPVVVITDKSLELQRQISCGMLGVLDRPLDTDRLLRITSRLSTPPSQGSLNGFVLAGLLRLIEVERKSCVVNVVSNNDERGSLVFLHGRLVHAETRQASGDRAARVIVAWASPKVEIRERTTLHPTTVTGSLPHLLLEAARLEDPERAEKPVEPSGRGPAPAETSISSDTLNSMFRRLVKSNGFVAVSVIDVRRAERVRTCRRRTAELNDSELDLMVSTLCRMIQAERELAASEGSPSGTNLMIRLRGSWHLLRGLSSSWTLHLILDNSGNAALAQYELNRLLEENALDVELAG